MKKINVIKMECLECTIKKDKYGCCSNPNCDSFELSDYRELVDKNIKKESEGK